MPRVATYRPKEVLISFAGIPLSSGIAEDSFVTIEYDEDAYSDSVGAGGEVTRTLSSNLMAKVTLKIRQTSQVNDLLSNVANTDRLLGTGVAPFFMKELRGTTQVSSADAWIMKMPKVERGAKDTDVEWVFRLAEAEMTVGGMTA